MCFACFFSWQGGGVHSDLLWLLRPFGVGCQLNELCGAAGVGARCGTSAEETR